MKRRRGRKGVVNSGVQGLGRFKLWSVGPPGQPWLGARISEGAGSPAHRGVPVQLAGSCGQGAVLLHSSRGASRGRIRCDAYEGLNRRDENRPWGDVSIQRDLIPHARLEREFSLITMTHQAANIHGNLPSSSNASVLTGSLPDMTQEYPVRDRRDVGARIQGGAGNAETGRERITLVAAVAVSLSSCCLTSSNCRPSKV